MLNGNGITEDNGGAFRERLKEMYTARELLRGQLHREFQKSDLDAMQKAYTSGSVDNAGVLRRCILNILFKAWGMR